MIHANCMASNKKSPVPMEPEEWDCKAVALMKLSGNQDDFVTEAKMCSDAMIVGLAIRWKSSGKCSFSSS